MSTSLKERFPHAGVVAPMVAVATLAASVGAVWWSGDARAAGVVVMSAGLVVGIVVARVEFGAAGAPASPAARVATPGEAGTYRKAA